MPDYGKLFIVWMKEHRYAQIRYILASSPLLFGCSANVLEKYIIAGKSLELIKDHDGWISLEPLIRKNDEVYPWEK
jgi:hypothetical protein